MGLLRLARPYSTSTRGGSLSKQLKQLIQAPWCDPIALSAPKTLPGVLGSIIKDTKRVGLGASVWPSIAAATVATLNSPEALRAIKPVGQEHGASVDEDLIREVVLKCISFNGIPKTINTLAALPPRESTKPVKELLPERPSMSQQGLELWNSIYGVHSTTLIQKLGTYHPDLPQTIVNHNYGPLLSRSRESFSTSKDFQPVVGRILTSIVACCCLRAQRGASMQLTSHIHGLLNAYKNEAKSEERLYVDPSGFLARQKGITVLLLWVDRIVDAFNPAESPGIELEGIKTKISPTSTIDDIESSEIS